MKHPTPPLSPWWRAWGLLVGAGLQIVVGWPGLPGFTQGQGPIPAPQALATPIPLREPAGQELQRGSDARADYGPLSQEFETQANLSYCGVASLVMVLNSLGVPAPAVPGYPGYHFWTQENVFGGPGGDRFVQAERVRREGMTLAQLHGWSSEHGLVVRRFHGDQLNLEQFRQLLREDLRDGRDRLMVNYLRSGIAQKGGGHISPIAAYDSRSDRVLILDVARYRYPAVWVKSEALWRSMGEVDKTSGQSRGLLSVRLNHN